MTAEILKIQKEKAKDGGWFWYVFFKDIETKKSFRACVYERYRNFYKWQDIIEKNSVGLVLTNLDILRDKVVDADSTFKIVPSAPTCPDMLPAAVPADQSPKPKPAPIFCDFCGVKFGNEIVNQLSVALEGEIIKLNSHTFCIEEVFETLRAGKDFQIKEMNEKLLQKAKAKKEKII